MKLPFFLYLILLLPLNMHAQSYPKDLPGEYYLSGVMETASGFKLNPDHTFEFFFSQGALDRTSKGTWEYNNDHIVFNSPPAPGPNFTLVSSKKIDNDSLTIQIKEPNTMLLSYVEVYYKIGDQEFYERTSSEGIVRFPKPLPEDLNLIFYFTPERPTKFKLENKDHNYYEFRFEPWLFDLYLNNFILKYDIDKLFGSHPLLEGQKFNYMKN